MTRTSTRTYALRIIDAIKYIKENDASREDCLNLITELLEDYVSEYLEMRAKRGSSPLGDLVTSVNRGDYAVALTQVKNIHDVDLAVVIQTLLEALLEHGSNKDIYPEGSSDL